MSSNAIPLYDEDGHDVKCAWCNCTSPDMINKNEWYVHKECEYKVEYDDKGVKCIIKEDGSWEAVQDYCDECGCPYELDEDCDTDYPLCECDDDDCDDCKVSKSNPGGCDCQIITCDKCGDEDHKYNHNLQDDGKLLCDCCNTDE